MKTKEIIRYIDENNGMITTEEAEKLGINRMALSRLSHRGLINRISRGVYILSGELDDMQYLIQCKCHKCIFSHESALYHYGLTDRTPMKNTVTVPSNYGASHLKNLPVKIRYIKLSYIDLGKIKIESSNGNLIYMYDCERTICDIIRSRNKMDFSIVNSAIREYMKSKDKDLSKLMFYAREMGIERLVIEKLGVLL